MIRFPILIVAGVLSLGLLAAGSAHAQGTIVTRFDVQSVISPELPPDGKNDTSRIRFTLSQPANASLVIFEADSITPVVTLLPDTIRTSGDVLWNGKNAGGSVVPEGAYVVTLFARAAANPDTVSSLPIFVDMTAPQIQIVSAQPNPYAPGAPLSTQSINIAFTVSNASPQFPGRAPDELRSTFTPPVGADITPASLTITPPFAGQNGSYVLTWNATAEPNALADGEFTVMLTLADVAGYTATSTVHFDVDTRAPDVKATSLPENISLATVPDNLELFAFDTHGIDSLAVRYATDRPYRLVTGAVVIDDTLRFAVPLADSFPAEGLHVVEFRATDIFGRGTTYPFTFRFDASAPPAPVVDATGGTWNTARYPLTVRANDGGEFGAFVRIYRNGALVDSASTAQHDTVEIDVELVPGRNDIYATLRDAALNESAPSNTVRVTFDTGAGLFARAPFRPGDSFDINASRTASGCTLRLFDMTGQIVKILEDNSVRQYYALPWDGVNGSGVNVRKGPLIAVASIDYGDGARDIFREVFLYDPDAP